MVSIFRDGVKTAKKRSEHPIDYRCPFCGSRKWTKRTRDRNLCYKYRCANCKCEFNQLKSVFIVTDESKDDNRFAECPVCGCMYTFGELSVLQIGDEMRTIRCECEETIFRVGVDSKGNRVIDVRCLNDHYMNIQESR